MKPVIIRHSREEDIVLLVDLYREFHEFHVEGVPDRLQRPSVYDSDDLRKRLIEVMEGEDSAIFIAESDGQVVGLAEVYIKDDQANPYVIPYRYGFLQSMVVSENYRKHGIGKRLLYTIEQWARERGASEVRLNIWEFERGPLIFYEKQGYRTLRRTMLRKL
jgi:GNAT superfamily N-acetyltransferase